MDKDSLKMVVGAVAENQPATIRLFGEINEFTATQFQGEFEWLENVVRPSKITVLINSSGGSCVHGMSIFSLIYNSPIDTECVIEGIAASMGSIIWSAGDQLKMHDFSLLMIHNPFCYTCSDETDPNAEVMVKAFKQQLETIYRKRFGMSVQQVREIMDGAEGIDGTWFTANDAVKQGFLPKENIIKTSKQLRDEAKESAKGTSDPAALCELMNRIAAKIDLNNLSGQLEANTNKKEETIINNSPQMDKTETIETAEATVQETVAQPAVEVEAKESEPVQAAEELAAVKATVTDLNIKLTAKETELANAKAELAEVQSQLKAYKEAENAAKEAEITATVENAIKEGKIQAESKEKWTELAHANFELVKDSLAAIQAREVISAEIAKDPENTEHIQEALADVDQQVRAEFEKRFGKVQYAKF